MIPIPIQEYEAAMRDDVCSVCVCFAPDKQNPGRCVQETSGRCSLFAHLSEVVGATSAVNSSSMEPYTNELRRTVCAKCDHQNKLGICDLRDSRGPMPAWCVLDTYFNLIVGAIEDVQRMRA
jgi:hypothetical protein